MTNKDNADTCAIGKHYSFYKQGSHRTEWVFKETTCQGALWPEALRKSNCYITPPTQKLRMHLSSFWIEDTQISLVEHFSNLFHQTSLHDNHAMACHTHVAESRTILASCQGCNKCIYWKQTLQVRMPGSEVSAATWHKYKLSIDSLSDLRC